MTEKQYAEKFGHRNRNRPLYVDYAAALKQLIIWQHSTTSGVTPYSPLEKQKLKVCQRIIDRYWQLKESDLPWSVPNHHDDIKPNYNFYPDESNVKPLDHNQTKCLLEQFF